MGGEVATGRPTVRGQIWQAIARAAFARRRALTARKDDFSRTAHAAFRDFVLREEFPCLGARAALNSGSYVLTVYDALASDSATLLLAQDLRKFTQSDLRRRSEFATFIAIFREPVPHRSADPEAAFENAMWQQLQMLNRIDATHFEWDPSVRSDPADPQFSFSFAGQALYVIGMHPDSSREARRFRCPALIFNPHEQFERLRADGKWKHMQKTIRERDRALQGTINPMLSDFGEATEARQYSGRAVEDDWRAPFAAVKPAAAKNCPFGF